MMPRRPLSLSMVRRCGPADLAYRSSVDSIWRPPCSCFRNNKALGDLWPSLYIVLRHVDRI